MADPTYVLYNKCKANRADNGEEVIGYPITFDRLCIDESYEIIDIQPESARKYVDTDFNNKEYYEGDEGIVSHADTDVKERVFVKWVDELKAFYFFSPDTNLHYLIHNCIFILD